MPRFKVSTLDTDAFPRKTFDGIERARAERARKERSTGKTHHIIAEVDWPLYWPHIFEKRGGRTTW